MYRKTLALTASLAALAFSGPVSATGDWGGGGSHKHTCWCGHQTCSSTSSSTSGGTTSSTSGGTTSSGGPEGSTSGGGSPEGGSSSGGTQVPEPGMLGLAGAGMMGLGLISLRRRRHTK